MTDIIAGLGSIFGNIAQDIADVPDDPFYIKPNTYWALCTESFMKQGEQPDKETGHFPVQLIITWTIDEPDNDYHHKNKTEYFDLYPHRESWEDYTPEEKQRTIWLKRRMSRAFDLSESELATINCKDLIGKGAYVTFRESEGKKNTANEGKKFINISDALSKSLYEEENGTTDTAANSLGLGV
jgi:hypothetical protein